MADFIALFILIASLSGMVSIIFRKTNVLLTLPQVLPQRETPFLELKGRLKKLNFLKHFSSEIFLQKIISKIRILSLKVDNFTFRLLKKLREKYQRKKLEKEDNYWEEVKKIKNERSEREENTDFNQKKI